MTLPEAIANLARIHAEFPFAESRIDHLLRLHSGNISTIQPHEWPRSFRVHVAAMLAMASGALIEKGNSRLGFAYNANAQRSGKTLLAKIVIAAFYGWTQVRTWPSNDRKRTDESEIRKSLDAIALETTPYILFDNVKGMVSSEALEAFMTAPVWTGRIMGNNNKTFTAEHSTTVVLTGNNLMLSTDNMARFLICDLAVEEADAQDRHVSAPIEESWVMKNQSLLRECVLTMIMHWVGKGMPPCSGSLRRGFESWCKAIGGMVECVGLGDLFEKRQDDDSTSGSPDDNDLRKLCLHIINSLDLDKRSASFKFDSLVRLCHDQALLTRFLDGKEESEMVDGQRLTTLVLSAGARSRFGNFLKRYAPEKRGRTWTFPPTPEHPYVRVCRLQCQGHDRTREYIARLEIAPRDEILIRLRTIACTWEQFADQILAPAHLALTLDALSDLEIATLNASWHHTIRPTLTGEDPPEDES